MNRQMVLFSFLVVFLTGCSGFLTTTADSVEDIRWSYATDLQGMRPALQLDCGDVSSCHTFKQYPDKYFVEDGTEELYVWVREYFPGSYLFYVVVYRPYENTWEGLGFEKIAGTWTIGVRTGTMYVKSASYPIWDKTSVETGSVVLGYRGESWAVVVNATSASTFEYKMILDYWNK